MSDQKATEQELAELHGEFARYLKTVMKRSQKIMDNSGEEDAPIISASVLNVVRSFLNDNHIELDPSQGNKGSFAAAMDGLDRLPFQTPEMAPKESH